VRAVSRPVRKSMCSWAGSVSFTGVSHAWPGFQPVPRLSCEGWGTGVVEGWSGGVWVSIAALSVVEQISLAKPPPLRQTDPYDWADTFTSAQGRACFDPWPHSVLTGLLATPSPSSILRLHEFPSSR
jgi:hypothetical protein